MTIKTYAVITSGSVSNVIALDDVAEASFAASSGLTLVDIGTSGAGIGWTYSGGVFAAPVIEVTLSEAQAVQIASLSASCQAYLLAGFTSSALGSVHAYPSKLTDQQNQASVAASGAGGSLWCETGSVWGFVAHTDEQATQVVADWKTYLNAAQAKLQTLAASVNAATTVAAVQAISW